MSNYKKIRNQLEQLKKDPSWRLLLESACSATAGASFGAALTAAGVHLPRIIIDQFKLTNFHMFNVFSVALGSSIFVILALDKLNIVKRQVRPSTQLGLFSPYDGNILGGALVGLGMSLSGSCPGTVTAQLAQAVPTAGVTALGGLFGGMAHLWFNKPTQQRPSQSASIAAKAESITDVTSVKENNLYLVVAVGWMALLLFTWPRDGTLWQAAAPGGLWLGSAQLVSLLLTSSSLGASGVYDQAGRYAWRALGSREIDVPALPPRSLLFAVGAVVGSFLLTAGSPPVPSGPTPSLASAAIGGFIMAFGAKMGKGCTSGHGLSGLGSLSFASLISVCSMFGAGILFQMLKLAIVG